jgi:hypothetical protein
MCALLALIFSKDLLPHFLKKPLDAIEVLIVNKAALVLLVFPVMFHEAHAASPHGAQSVVALAAGTMIALVVWMVGHAADVLALLSPIPFLDLIVKASRAGVMLFIAGSALVNPTLGLIVSGIVIAICAVLFGFATRTMILGWMFALDLLFWRRQMPQGASVQAFTMGKNAGMPRQTLGRLTRDASGALEFRYRRMGFGPSRRIKLDSSSRYDVGRGLVYPSILANDRVILRLLPRYRGSEEAVREALGVATVKDLGLGKLVARKAQ